jgi:hypothetical protein
MTAAMEFDPSVGRTYLPRSKFEDLKSVISAILTEHHRSVSSQMKKDALNLRIIHLDPEKHYYIVVPPETGSDDIEAVLNILKELSDNHPNMKSMRLLITNGIDISDSKTGPIIEALIEAVREEVRRSLGSHTEVNQADIDIAMNAAGGNMSSVHQIEVEMAKQRQAFIRAIDQVDDALKRVGSKLGDKYYVIDKQDVAHYAKKATDTTVGPSGNKREVYYK